MRSNIDAVYEIQRLYPQIYLACHVDHVRAASTSWKLSARDSSLLSHLHSGRDTSPRELAAHLGVAASTLSAAISRLQRYGYITSSSLAEDRRQRALRLTPKGGEALRATSVLDADRLTELLLHLSPREQKAALRGLVLLAGAARKMRRS